MFPSRLGEEQALACAASSGNLFLPLSPVCCPVLSTPACPHLFPCFLLLSHLIASNHCLSGFAFWTLLLCLRILWLSLRATVINSLSQVPAYISSLQNPCPANSGASTYVLVLHVASSMCFPLLLSFGFSLLLWDLCPTRGRSFLGFPAICTYCFFADLPSSAWVSSPWAVKPGFFLTSVLQLWAFGLPPPFTQLVSFPCACCMGLRMREHGEPGKSQEPPLLRCSAWR